MTLAKDLMVNFAAANESNISRAVPVPDGALEIDGAWMVSSRCESHTLTLAATAPLAYDAECARIVGGTLEARGDGGAVRVTWTGCGAYTETLIADGSRSAVA
ncbi:MAG TPA: hypothetical protein P5319_00020 [Gemmatimonadales bacterium]|nr:hypothetical protein [Gemmatimonadales bacterium]